MHVFDPPSGFKSLHEARNELRRAMHQGVPCSEEVERLRSEGIDASDHTQTMSAVKILREATKSGGLSVYTVLSPCAQPRQLSTELCQIAVKPKDGTVLTFAYLSRHRLAPFDRSWPDVEQLTRAPLFVETQAFNDLQRESEQKKAWPCHAITAKPKKRRGRPRKADDVIGVLREFDASGRINPSMEINQIYDLVKEALSGTLKVSKETVRRCCHEAGIAFVGSYSRMPRAD
jgi:hypothetical protein